MFDKSLQMDLQDFKKGAENINDLQERYNNIRRVVKNRTKEKLNFLKYLEHNNLICNELHQELIDRVNYDLKISYLYIMGIVNNL